MTAIVPRVSECPGIPDPDVATVEITAAVTGLRFDSANEQRCAAAANAGTTTRVPRRSR
jgi:hypothetical protein